MRAAYVTARTETSRAGNSVDRNNAKNVSVISLGGLLRIDLGSH